MTKLYRKGITLFFSSILAVGMSGCLKEDNADINSDGTAKEINSGESSSGSATEKSASNDTYTDAQSIDFGDDKSLVSGSANSTSDEEDWYSFTAPETGQYVCGLKHNDGLEFKIYIYHQGHYSVGGEDGSTYTYSEHKIDAGYKEIDYPANSSLQFNTINGDIQKGSTSYIRVIANSTGGNDAKYTLECFTPKAYKYSSSVQTGKVVETNNIMNLRQRLALPIAFDSSMSIDINGSINSERDKEDYFKFKVFQAQAYDINVSGTTGIRFYLKNRDETTRLSIGSITDDKGIGVNVVLPDGEYYLYVEGYSTGGLDAAYSVLIH